MGRTEDHYRQEPPRFEADLASFQNGLFDLSRETDAHRRGERILAVTGRVPMDGRDRRKAVMPEALRSQSRIKDSVHILKTMKGEANA